MHTRIQHTSAGLQKACVKKLPKVTANHSFTLYLPSRSSAPISRKMQAQRRKQTTGYGILCFLPASLRLLLKHGRVHPDIVAQLFTDPGEGPADRGKSGAQAPSYTSLTQQGKVRQNTWQLCDVQANMPFPKVVYRLSEARRTNIDVKRMNKI